MDSDENQGRLSAIFEKPQKSAKPFVLFCRYESLCRIDLNSVEQHCQYGIQE